MFSYLRKVREIYNGRRLHLLVPASRLAWSAAKNSAKDIDLTGDLDIQRQPAAQPLQSAKIPRRLVESSRNHGFAVLVPVGDRGGFHFPSLCTLQPVMRGPRTTSSTHHLLGPDVMRLAI